MPTSMISIYINLKVTSVEVVDPALEGEERHKFLDFG